MYDENNYYPSVDEKRSEEPVTESFAGQEESRMTHETAGQSQDIAHMQLAEPENVQTTAASSEKKRRVAEGVGKSAVNGIVFGLCAALVICIVLIIGNKTFLKTDSSQTEEPTSETWVPSTDTESEVEDDDADVEEAQTEVESVKPQQTALNMTGDLSVKDIAKQCMPSVVSITTVGVEDVRSWFGTQKYKSQGAGSGIIIGQNDSELLVATNNHVVSGAEEVSVCFDDDSEDAVISAKVKGTDPSNDLAIVAVLKEDISDEIMGKIKVAKLGDSDSLSIGEQVVAIGNALGYGQSVTTGIISALDRSVDIESYSAKLIQTDAAINPGNSGGALLNMRGELIGINSAKFASEEVEGMGYAIPIATAQPILDNLMNRETRELVDEKEAGFLGVSVQDVSKEASELYDIPKGAYVGSVEEGGGAAKAGIKKGDIITKFDGLAVSDSSSLRSNIAYYKAGETVDVVIMRANNGVYEEQTVSVTLAKSKNIEQQKKQGNEEQKDDQQQNEEQDEVEEESEPNGGLEVPDQDGFDSFRDFFGDGDLRKFFGQFSE